MLHADAPARSISTQLPQTLLIGSVEASCLATERSPSGLNSSTEWWTLVRQRLLPTVQTVGKTEEIPQVQSFDKVDMAFAVRDQSRQRITLLMLRMFSFLIE